MLRNSERHTVHQVVKKNKNTGRPGLDIRPVDFFVPSNKLISNWGSVLPTSVPIDGSSTTLALVEAGFELALDPKMGLGLSTYAWVEGISGEEAGVKSVDTSPGAAIGSDGRVAEDSVGVSVADIPQADIPTSIAINGKANIRDIRGVSQQWK